jgi:hypothetical protein
MIKEFANDKVRGEFKISPCLLMSIPLACLTSQMHAYFSTSSFFTFYPFEFILNRGVA